MPVTNLELSDMLKRPDVTLVDGLPKRWCHGTPGQGCGHFITTREETWDTENCNAKFNKPTWMSWRQPTLTKAEILEKLLHIPHCKSCLGHNNSYLFPAWYDISKAKIIRLAELYERNWPDNLQQPYFYPFDDNGLVIRIETHDVDHEGDGEIEDLDTLITKFFICTYWPEKDEKGNYPDTSVYEEYEFDLSLNSGWQKLLETFPQPPLLKI